MHSYNTLPSFKRKIKQEIEITKKLYFNLVKAKMEVADSYLKDVTIITKKDASNRDRMIFVFKNINLCE